VRSVIKCRPRRPARNIYPALVVKSEKGDPARIVRRYAAEHDLAGDVQRAGYPQSEPPVFRLVSDGDVAATVELLADGEGGWLVSTVNRCSS
jgi:hypothetical protein